jgi:hypothetical protein
MLQIRLQKIIYLADDFCENKLLIQPRSLDSSVPTAPFPGCIHPNSEVCCPEVGVPDSIADPNNPFAIQSAPQNISPANLPIVFKQVRHPTRIIYSTALAHRLAAHHQLPATAIAAQIADAIQSPVVFPQPPGQQTPPQDCSWSDSQLQHVRVWVTETGLIQFEPDDRAIAAWLECVIQHPYPLQDFPSEALSVANLASDSHLGQRLLMIQHAHARCCSLLRLAHTEGLIILEQPDSQSPLTWRFTRPARIPWLTQDNQLLLNHPADRRLIRSLLAALDYLSHPTAAPTANTTLKLAEETSQTFAAFHAAHPLFGISPADPSNTSLFAQLGCLLVTQRVLYLLLVVLDFPAPTEL